MLGSNANNGPQRPLSGQSSEVAPKIRPWAVSEKLRQVQQLFWSEGSEQDWACSFGGFLLLFVAKTAAWILPTSLGTSPGLTLYRNINRSFGAVSLVGPSALIDALVASDPSVLSDAMEGDPWDRPGLSGRRSASLIRGRGWLYSGAGLSVTILRHSSQAL